MHIDFGFILTSSPGGNMRFEKAPFKLTNEMVEIMGGVHSEPFRAFRLLFCRGFVRMRKRRENILQLARQAAQGIPDSSCFVKGTEVALAELEARFFPDMRKVQVVAAAQALVNQSINNWRTTGYDRIQLCCQGIKI